MAKRIGEEEEEKEEEEEEEEEQTALIKSDNPHMAGGETTGSPGASMPPHGKPIRNLFPNLGRSLSSSPHKKGHDEPLGKIQLHNLHSLAKRFRITFKHSSTCMVRTVSGEIRGPVGVSRGSCLFAVVFFVLLCF